MNWFLDLTGFRESSAEDVHARIEIFPDGFRMRVRATGQVIVQGRLELPSLAELRARALPRDGKSQLRVSEVVGDVTALHCDMANAGAAFQVASQFNLLEMIGPHLRHLAMWSAAINVGFSVLFFMLLQQRHRQWKRKARITARTAR